jgi:cytochrome b
MAPMNGSIRTVLVWDRPTRLFHWIVVVLVAAAYLTWRLNWMEWHAKVGYALLATVIFRILWGFFGSETARFTRFLATPRAACRHLARVWHREPDRQVGHNPAGGWMVLLLLLLMLAETLTGIYVGNDVADEGPLSELMPASMANAITALHAFLWDALLAAVALHLAAIAIYTLVKGHDLLRPMITGRKSLPAGIPPPRLSGLARAVVLLCGSALTVAVLVNVL